MNVTVCRIVKINSIPERSYMILIGMHPHNLFVYDPLSSSYSYDHLHSSLADNIIHQKNFGDY